MSLYWKPLSYHESIGCNISHCKQHTLLTRLSHWHSLPPQTQPTQWLYPSPLPNTDTHLGVHGGPAFVQPRLGLVEVVWQFGGAETADFMQWVERLHHDTLTLYHLLKPVRREYTVGMAPSKATSIESHGTLVFYHFLKPARRENTVGMGPSKATSIQSHGTLAFYHLQPKLVKYYMARVFAVRAEHQPTQNTLHNVNLQWKK